MEALRVQISGDVTSFRYPHFIQGVHLSYEMPPPTTIYGHVASTLGYLFEPHHLSFAYHFAYESKFEDYEHLHFFRNKLPTPFRRELLFRPQLTLYLRPNSGIALEELYERFRHPCYAVALGRSQDLMTYDTLEVVALRQVEQAFYSGTLLPLADAARLGGRFYAVTMPRYINEDRYPTWAQYAVLPEADRPPISDEAFSMAGEEHSIWVDASFSHPLQSNIKRGIIWHDWV